MTRPDRPGGLKAYQRVFLRSKGLFVPDPDPHGAPTPAPDESGGPEPAVDPLTVLTPPPGLGTPPTTPGPPFTGDAANLSPPTFSLTPPEPPTLVIGDYDGETRGLIPPYRREDANNRPPRTFDDIRRASTSQNRGDVDDENDQHLGINIAVDDAYSEASSRFRAKRSQYAASRSWRRGRGGGGGDGSDSDKSDKVANDGEDEAYDTDLDSQASQGGIRKPREHARKLWKWKSLVANRYEHMLLECIVNIGTSWPTFCLLQQPLLNHHPDTIPPRYENMFIHPSIIQELERVTKRSLERQKAFNHGVLQGNRVTGGILWGPPGTGKSLLAKGLAKQSGCNMLAVSTAELWQKCHGEDEKVIKALFSFGRKLKPCIIFVDEADALLGTRKAGEKRHLRAMLNQFLMCWDGLSSDRDSPFVLLATNRPTDLDPAVLRRAPVHIEIGLPDFEARRGILGLLLRGETMGPAPKVQIINQLARLTDRYSGSDLKNLCVTAATLAVDEQPEDTDIRTLTTAHFEEAMKKVRPVAMSAVNKNELDNFGRRGGGEGAGGGGAHGMYDDD